jgi:hypothetical protein
VTLRAGIWQPPLHAGEWLEDEHPRSDDGKFAPKGGETLRSVEWRESPTVITYHGLSHETKLWRKTLTDRAGDDVVEVNGFVRPARPEELTPGAEAAWVSDVEALDLRGGRERLAYHRERTFRSRDEAERDLTTHRADLDAWPWSQFMTGKTIKASEAQTEPLGPGG